MTTKHDPLCYLNLTDCDSGGTRVCHCALINRVVARERAAANITAPPEPFTLPTILCPSCGHGIDPHGADPGGTCGVGDEDANPCPCLWQPNDIAAILIALAARSRIRKNNDD
jgi:hypothetical protein